MAPGEFPLQRSAREVIERLHQVHQYDLMHHATFAGFRYPIAVWGHGVPCIWGPIGGIESIPRPLLPWHHARSLAQEMMRNANNLLQSAPFHVLPKRARASTLILASTPEMQQVFGKLGFETRLMPTIGLNFSELPYQPHRPPSGPLKLLFVGNIITLKGVDLALAAFKEANIAATFTLIGTGNYLAAAKTQVRHLGIGDRVHFQGRLPREEVLKVYREHDVFFFPSLHDTGGYAVIEAMFNELPVICLDCGGPAVAVKENCGIKVPLGSRSKVVSGLAAAIRAYDRDRSALTAHGKAARDSILLGYDWERKGIKMNECYQSTVARAKTEERHVASAGYSGMGGIPNLLHRMFSVRGVVASIIFLMLLGAVGFFSVGHLKSLAREIVTDTLPGLSYAGEANAGLAQAFNRMLLLVMTENPQQEAKFRREISEYSQETTVCLEAYQRQIFAQDDRLLFEKLMRCRRDYLALREQTISLLDQHKRAEAEVQLENKLAPAYRQYKEAGDHLFEYNMQQGKSRGETIMTVCTATQLVVAVFFVLVFAVGFLIGMFK